MAQMQSGPVASEFLEKQTLVRTQESRVSSSQGVGRLSCLVIASWGLGAPLAGSSAAREGRPHPAPGSCGTWSGRQGGRADQLGDIGR